MLNASRVRAMIFYLIFQLIMTALTRGHAGGRHLMEKASRFLDKF
jgi:hypothetical protein